MLIIKQCKDISVANLKEITRMAESCAEAYRKGNDMVIVVSAMGKYTDTLLDMAHEITSTPSARELDMLLSIAEQQAAALLSMALEALDIPAISFHAYQTQIHAEGTHGDARITQVAPACIRTALAQRQIVIVTGSQGMDEKKDLLTLRGGAAATALALAEALDADACVVDTDTEINTDMLRMAPSDAEMLHSRCIEPAQKHTVPLSVRSGMNRRDRVAEKIRAGQR